MVKLSCIRQITATFATSLRLRSSVGKNVTRKYSNITSVKMAYTVYEEKAAEANALPPLIIMHGLFGSKNNFRSVGRAISSTTGRMVISVDARNHGESPHTDSHTTQLMAADVGHLMQTLRIKRASVMGHSMGGRAMMYFALQYPQMVEKLIVADMSPVSMPADFRGMDRIFVAMKNLQVPKNLSMGNGRKYAEEEMLKTINSRSTVDFMLMNLRKSPDGSFYWTHNVECLHRDYLLLQEFREHVSVFPPFTGPTIFICGKQSDFMDPDTWPEVLTIFPNAELLWLDAGHLVHFEEPAEFIRMVNAFLVI